jgi:hypothetical protein
VPDRLPEQPAPVSRHTPAKSPPCPAVQSRATGPPRRRWSKPGSPSRLAEPPWPCVGLRRRFFTALGRHTAVFAEPEPVIYSAAFDNMGRYGLKPDAVALNSLLSAVGTEPGTRPFHVASPVRTRSPTGAAAAARHLPPTLPV